MVDYEKTESFTRSRASISSRSGGENNLENHPAAMGVSSNFGPQANRASSETRSSVAAKKIGVETTEQEFAPLESVPTSSKRGIDWRSPAFMFVTFLIGLAATVGQHVYYSSLAGDLVGCNDQQQLVLRWVLPNPIRKQIITA